MLQRPTEFADWTKNRAVHCIGTNARSEELPFQGWQHFKEAFAPELLKRAVDESQIPVRSCLDPFGGSGTTSLACQFLGVEPTTIEINPYLADLIEAKLYSYDADALSSDFGRVLMKSRAAHSFAQWKAKLPSTFVEPGVNERWLFNTEVADEIFRIRTAIESLESKAHQRFFLVQLGGILIAASNVRISGKGRRYRSNWEERCLSRATVRTLFCDGVQRSILEIHQFRFRAMRRYKVVRGDARTKVAETKQVDLVVFSPPYPNSFDYTDVYNIELWMLGYLHTSEDNKALRRGTLSSHVQIKRDFEVPALFSAKLRRTLAKLNKRRGELWSPHIPAMVGAYFAELSGLMKESHKHLNRKGSAWIVVGDSQYAGIRIDVAGILEDIALEIGFKIRAKEPFRSMRSSPQQGGKAELPETLLILDKP